MSASKNFISYLEDLLSYLEYCNDMAPFPHYDTEYVDMVRQRLKEMKKNRHSEYDKDPVSACKYCYNLFIVVDDVENDVCMRCGSINELTIYKDIFEYLTAAGHYEHN